MMDLLVSTWWMIPVVVFLIAAWALPVIIALVRHVKDLSLVVLVTIIGGFTVIGWPAALYMACQLRTKSPDYAQSSSDLNLYDKTLDQRLFGTSGLYRHHRNEAKDEPRNTWTG